MGSPACLAVDGHEDELLWISAFWMNWWLYRVPDSFQIILRSLKRWVSPSAKPFAIHIPSLQCFLWWSQPSPEVITQLKSAPKATFWLCNLCALLGCLIFFTWKIPDYPSSYGLIISFFMESITPPNAHQDTVSRRLDKSVSSSQIFFFFSVLHLREFNGIKALCKVIVFEKHNISNHRELSNWYRKPN